jgi:hypothetical protein
MTWGQSMAKAETMANNHDDDDSDERGKRVGVMALMILLLNHGRSQLSFTSTVIDIQAHTDDDDVPHRGSSQPAFPNLPDRAGYRLLDYTFNGIFAVEFVARLLVAEVCL